VSELSRTPGGAPTPWGLSADPYRRAPYPYGTEHDPTAGRHALDEDAAMTPIFTALRRGSWRRPPVRPDEYRDPVDRFRQDPPTTPIPLPIPTLVPPAREDRLAAVGPETSPVGGYRYSGRGYGAPGDDEVYGEYAEYAEYEVDDRVGAAWDRDPYAPASFGPRPADRIPVGTADFLLRQAAPARRPERPAMRTPDRAPTAHELVSDTGRHHRRLAPAGW
jgi:hypothetical protein